jgi:hypothetical protein
MELNWEKNTAESAEDAEFLKKSVFLRDLRALRGKSSFL